MVGKGNYVFIDGQNLHLGTTAEIPPRKIDFPKFRKYLLEKYNITKAFYFLGHIKNEYNDMYTNLQSAGFIVLFKQQTLQMRTSKKGNIDSDLIFNVMKLLVDNPDEFDKIMLISWDGDYKILVDYLIKKERLLKILFPNKKFASSLYKSLETRFFDYLANIKHKIAHET